jgi:hypothetical protein
MPEPEYRNFVGRVSEVRIGTSPCRNLIPKRTMSHCRAATDTTCLPTMAKAGGALHREVHLLQQFAVALVAAQAIHMRIDLQAAQARVTLFVGTVQPLKCFVRLAPIREYLSDLVSHVCLMVRDELRQSGVRIAGTTESVVSQGFTRQFPNLGRLLFHFS